MNQTKPTYSLAIQAKDTGRFLMSRRIGTKTWGFAATCVGGSMPLQFITEMVKENTGRDITAIMSFVKPITEPITYYHQWFDTECKTRPLEGQELEWFSLFDFPRKLAKPVLLAMRDKIFLQHIIEPHGIWS